MSVASTPASGAPRRGFTLLEVMVAVAILGIGLVVILTAQTGLFSSAKRAAVMSDAVGLARCKMSELEEHLLRMGFQLTAEDDEGPCCDDEDSQMRCKWTIAPVVLPEFNARSNADAGAGEASGGLTLDSLGTAKDELSKGDTQGAVSNLTEMLGASPAGAGPSMGAGALAPIAMGLIYPQLKAMLEASIRKVTVKVVWMEGRTERDLSVTQYITNPQQGGFLAEDESQAGMGGAAGIGGAAATGTKLGAGGRGKR